MFAILRQFNVYDCDISKATDQYFANIYYYQKVKYIYPTSLTRIIARIYLRHTDKNTFLYANWSMFIYQLIGAYLSQRPIGLNGSPEWTAIKA